MRSERLPQPNPLAGCIACVVLALPGPWCVVVAQETKPRLPEGDGGIAARFPGDEGIASHADVVFVEDFEQDSPAAVWERWDEVRAKESMSFSGEVPSGSSGGRSLVMDRQSGSGPSLFRRIPDRTGGWGHDRLFLRFYVKFAPDCGELHHGVSAFGGNHPATPYPVVRAGNRPDGTKGFWSGIEPHGGQWVWDYYTYWSEMRGSPPAGRTWGNTFVRDPRRTVERGKWICVEHMIRVNDVGKSNGEQALWIDGELISHLGEGFPNGAWVWDKFTPGQGGQGVRWGANGREDFLVPEGGAPFEGFRWRSSPELKVNFVWLYVYTEKPAGHRIQVAFDDVVVATSYIGPLKK